MTPISITHKHLCTVLLISLLFLFGKNNCTAQTITTLAGGIGDDSLATIYGRLYSPTSVAADAAGNLYIADNLNARIRKVTAATGVIKTLAGNGDTGSTISGLAIDAEINPESITVDGAGNIYLSSSNRILEINTSGVLSVIAGTGTAGYSGDGGLATAAKINTPYGIAVSAAGNIYIADEGNARIRMINTSGIISTIAGGGTGGIGDGGPATAGTVNPYGVAVDAVGNVYIADQNNERIREVNTAGIITTVAGNGTAGFSGDGGAATSAELYYPYDIKVDAAGNLFIPDKENQRIRKVNPSGVISTIAGNGTAGFSGDGGPATSAELYTPLGISLDAVGNVYVADNFNNRIRKISSSGTISTVAGNDTFITGYGGSGVPATLAKFGTYGVGFIAAKYLSGLCTDQHGNIYIADQSNNVVRKINTSGIITTIAGNRTAGFTGDGGAAVDAELNFPVDVSVDKYGNVYIADYENGRIRKVSTSGIITTFAGGGIAGLGDGGPATLAVISAYGVTVDSIGNVFIADGDNARVRKVDTSGIINTIAGTGTAGSTGDGGSAVTAELDKPMSLVLDRYGNLFISDVGSSNIRKVDTTGIISSFANIAGYQITIDSIGNLYVATSNNIIFANWQNIINKVDIFGNVTLVAGNGTEGYRGDDGPAVTAELIDPNAVTIDSARNLYIRQEGAIRKVCCMTYIEFTHGPTPVITLCESSGTVNIDTFLSVFNPYIGNTEKWSVSSSPAHGTLSGFPDSTTTTGTIITPSGLGYAATAGYAGKDTFKIKISDGADTSIAMVVVTINALPAAGTISGTYSSVCSGATITLSETVTGGTWSSSNTSIATVSSTGIVTGVASGIDTIKYSKSSTCGTAIATYPITVNISPAIITGTAIVCVGNTTNLTDTTTGGTWSSSNTGLASVGSTGIVTGIAAGTPTITYVVATGCKATIPVSVNALPNAGTITGPSSVCVGSPVTLFDGSSSGTWISSNTAVATVSGGSVTGVTAGTSTISYTVTNACGTAYATKVITVNVSASAGTITGPSAVCTSSSITLSDAVSGGIWTSSDPYIALGSASGVVVGLAPGTATVYYTITNSCGTSSTSTAVTVDDPPNAGTITGSTIMCAGGTDTLGDAVVGGTWSTSTPLVVSVSGTGVVSGLAAGAGVIYYTVTNACGSAQALTIVNVDASTPISYITGPSAVCTGANITLTDATPGGTWSSTDPAIGSISSSGVVTGISPGVTTISYTASLGCGLSVATAEITIDAAAYAGTISGTGAICIGADALLTATGIGGVWTAGNSNATISATGVITGVAAGTDVITYTVTNSCGSAYTTFITTVYPAPMAGTITGSTPVCSGSSISLTDATSGGIWSSGNSAIATVNTSGLVSGISGGTVAISYTISTGCGFASATAIVTVNNASAGTITGITSLCAGSTAALTDAVAGGSWSSSSTSVATVSSGGLVNAVASGTTIISYQVTGTCGTAIAAMAFVVDPLPSVSPITGTTSLCISATSTLADGTVGGIWSSSNTAIATVGSSSGLATGVSAGTCIISYALASGCGTSFAVIELSVAAPPSAGTISGTTTLCAGNTTSLTDAVTGGVWSSSATGIADVSGSGVVTGIASGTASILYTVSNFCGTATTTITANINAASAGTITGITDVCVGSTSQLTNATGGGLWSSSSTTVATISSSGLVNAISGGTTIISYSASGSCGSAVTTAIFTVGSLPVVPPLNGSASVCTGSSTTLTDGTSGGVWSSSNTLVALVSSAGTVTSAATGTTVISYTVNAGCGATTVSMTITVNAPPTAGTISGSTSVCQSATIALTDAVMGGIWSSSNAAIALVSAGGVVTGIDTGTAIISYTTSNSCGAATTTLPLTVLPAPYPGIITGNTNICVGAVTTLSDNVSGGTWTSFASTIAAVSATGLVTGLASGADVISYTISNSCGSNSATVVVNIDPLPDIAAITGTTTVGIGGTADLYNAIAGGSWSSSNTAVATVNGAGTISGISLGTAMITYTMINGFGCTDDTSVLITVVTSTGINQLSGNNGYRVYPNPATNEITITWQNQMDQNANVIISDVLGRELLNSNINLTHPTGSSSIDLSAFLDGTYVITVTSQSGYYTGKLIILK